MGFLPSCDRQYLSEKGIAFEELTDQNQRGLILRQLLVPHSGLSASSTDALVILPPGYNDVGPDMFYLFPWLKIAADGRYPRAADQPFNFNGQVWQRWSRHADKWRPGIDGMPTVLLRIRTALEVAR